MAIAFNNIPNTKIPGVYTEFDNSNALQGLNNQHYKALVIGQKTNWALPHGKTVQIYSKDQATTIAGKGSQLERMLHAFIDANSFTELHALPLHDPSGDFTTHTLTITESPTESGIFHLYIGGVGIHVPIPKAYPIKCIAGRISTYINNNNSLSFRASRTNNIVSIIAKNKGKFSNTIDIRTNFYPIYEHTPEGLKYTLTQTKSGKGVPDITNVLANLGEEQFNIIAHPFTQKDKLNDIHLELTDRWQPDMQIEGHAISVAKGTIGQLLNKGNENNSKHLTIFGVENTPTNIDEIAAYIAGVISFHAAIDPARPFQTLPISNMIPVHINNQFTRTEREQLLSKGISTLKTIKNTVQIERAVTTYKTSPSGAPDPSYMDLNTLLTLSYLRFDFNTYFLNKYPRHKLGEDSKRYGAGQPIMTPKLGKAEALNRFKLWEEVGLVEDFEQFKRDLIVERNLKDVNRLDFNMSPNLINGLRVVANKISFIL